MEPIGYTPRARDLRPIFSGGSICTTIMELGPQNHDGDWSLEPNSIIVVYMDPLGFLEALNANAGGRLLYGPWTCSSWLPLGRIRSSGAPPLESSRAQGFRAPFSFN